jgi:NADH-quinone oxidoreductase subunit L
MDKLLVLIPALPFVGFLINGLGFKRIPKGLAGGIGVIASLAAFVLSVVVLFDFLGSGQKPMVQELWTWMSGANWTVSFSLSADPLTFCMLMVVTGVGFLIHVFSLGYMHEDEGFGKFFCLSESLFILDAYSGIGQQSPHDLYWLGRCRSLFLPFDWILE